MKSPGGMAEFKLSRTFESLGLQSRMSALRQQSANRLRKGPNSINFRLCTSTGKNQENDVGTSRIRKNKFSQNTFMSNENLWTLNFEFHIIFTWHKCYSFDLFFPQLFKIVKSWEVGWIWPTDCIVHWLTPVLRRMKNVTKKGSCTHTPCCIPTDLFVMVWVKMLVIRTSVPKSASVIRER